MTRPSTSPMTVTPLSFDQAALLGALSPTQVLTLSQWATACGNPYPDVPPPRPDSVHEAWRQFNADVCYLTRAGLVEAIKKPHAIPTKPGRDAHIITRTIGYKPAAPEGAA